MATREQVQQLLRVGHSYASAAATLGVSAGQAYMIATGLPADRSDGEARQDLVNPVSHDPTRDEGVSDWVRERAGRELQ